MGRYSRQGKFFEVWSLVLMSFILFFFFFSAMSKYYLRTNSLMLLFLPISFRFFISAYSVKYLWQCEWILWIFVYAFLLCTTKIFHCHISFFVWIPKHVFSVEVFAIKWQNEPIKLLTFEVPKVSNPLTVLMFLKTRLCT